MPENLANEPTPAFEQPPSHLFLLVFAVLAIVVIATPLQHYIPLNRFQHYGICVFVFGLGYIAQATASWPRMPMLPRLCYVLTGLFFSSAGAVLINNPWLDSRMTFQTAEETILRRLIYYAYGGAGALLSMSWLLLAFWEWRTARREEKFLKANDSVSKPPDQEGSSS